MSKTQLIHFLGFSLFETPVSAAPYRRYHEYPREEEPNRSAVIDFTEIAEEDLTPKASVENSALHFNPPHRHPYESRQPIIPGEESDITSLSPKANSALVSYNSSGIESSDKDKLSSSSSSLGWNEVQQTVLNDIYPPSEDENPIAGVTDWAAQTDMEKVAGILAVGFCIAMLFLALSICGS